ncbi:MAG: PAS domain S-box protein [Chloroflexi bacterium]|nr:PAS domain S-box protein [Chloroflexota bacterium]
MMSARIARTPFRTVFGGWLGAGKQFAASLYPPPFRNWHFLMIQGLVIFIATVHALIETNTIHDQLHRVSTYHFHGYPLPTALFLVPVVYAALIFGFAGAVATAAWAALLSIPNVVVWHQGLERFEEIFQILVVIVVGFLVGLQVDRQKSAHRNAEMAAASLHASRMRYRSLFESSPVAILVLNDSGTIGEANPAANALFGQAVKSLPGLSLAEVLQAMGASRQVDPFRNGKHREQVLRVKLKDGSEVYLEQTLAETTDDQGNPVKQVLFRNVTEEKARHAGLQAYASHVIQAQEEERQRISRELHDEILQTLILLYRRLDGAEKAIEHLPPAMTGFLPEAKQLAEKTIEDLRDFTRALRPPILDDLGIVASIRRLLSDFSKRAGVEAKMRVTGKCQRLSPDIELGLFRIAQESLRNVEKHARASRVSVVLTCSPDSTKLEMVDNGIGFDIPVAPRHSVDNKQLGLISMQERARLLGGDLDIRSRPGNTSVTCLIPMDTSAATKEQGRETPAKLS